MYKGQTYRVPQVAGWNANNNLDHVPKEAMVDVENINIHRGGRQPRGGCEKVITTAITSTPEVLNLFHFIRENGTIEGGYVIDETDDYIGDENSNKIVFEGSFVVANTDGGILYKNYTTSLETGLTADTTCFFETYYDELFIANGVDAPRIWTDNEDYAWLMGTPKQCTATIAAGAGVTAGTHSYKVTFTTASGESTGGEASTEITTAGGNLQVELTAIPTGPTGTTARSIYRTQAGGTTYHELSGSPLADNTTVILTDNDADATIAGNDAMPTTNLAFLPTDWGDDPPKYFLKHGRGTHKRLWAIGCKSYPNIVYASKNGQADFSDTNVTTIKVMTDKLTGMAEFGGNLFVFSRDKTFIINDVAVNVINWGVQAAHWEGGAAHQRLIVKTPTDVAAMDEAGNIFSIKASQQYGDYEAGSLTKPHHLDKWIEDNIDLLLIDKFHAIYDPELRAIKWFMCENGYDFPNVCLVYYIDYAQWTRHSFTDIHSNTLYHLCSGLVKITQAVWRVYTGDEAGFVYKLESDTLLDGGAVYEKYYLTPPLPLDNPRMTKQFDKLTTIALPQGTEEIRYENFVDNVSQGVQRINMDAASTSVHNISSDIGKTGLRIQQRVSNVDANDFYISEIMLDFEPLGSGEDATYDTGSAISTITGYVFAGFAADYTQDASAYNTSTNAWVSVNDMPNPVRAYMAAVAILDDSFVLGGKNTSDDLRENDRYNPSADSWSGMADLPSPDRSQLAASNILNKAYVYAGIDSTTELGDCDEYNPSDDSWANKTVMGSPTRYMLGASTISDNGYVFCGYDGTNLLQDCDKYTQSTDAWSVMTSAGSPARKEMPAVTINSKAYVFGGVMVTPAYLQDCDEYDAVTNAWAVRTSMGSPARYRNAGSTVDSNGYSYAGSDGTDNVQDCDKYSASGDAWTAKTDMSTVARYSAAAT